MTKIVQVLAEDPLTVYQLSQGAGGYREEFIVTNCFLKSSKFTKNCDVDRKTYYNPNVLFGMVISD